MINSNELTTNEKLITMHNIFPTFDNVVKENRYIKNVGDFIVGNFEKIEGFDFRWSSLISNNPLLFEDINYLRIKSFIDNQITDNEIEAYKRGDLRDLYATFDNLLICNLRYYDRIINYCTMVFMNYIEIDGEYFKGKSAKIDKVPMELSLTPTKIWCAVLSNTSSTAWELEYAWNIKPVLPIENSDKSVFELSWNLLYKNLTFAKFNEWNAFRCGTNGFRETLLADITPNRKLSQVCTKFTKTSIAISEQQLDSLFDYVQEVDNVSKRLYTILDDCLIKMFNGDKSQYSIYIFTNDFFIFSSKFSIKVSKSEKGVISKDYLANSYECFTAEEYLVPSIKMQIEWAKYKMDNRYNYDKKILENLLTNMLDKNYREVICIKRISHDEINGLVSKITFKGVFNNVRIQEEFMIDNRTIKTTYKTLSKLNAAKYIINRGYYIFGLEKDLLSLSDINKKSLIKHYNNYCIPIITYMYDAIKLNTIYKNDIIDVVVEGQLNPGKINNDVIKFGSLTNIDTKAIMSKGLEYQNKQIKQNKKSYWKAVTEDN